MKILIKKNYGKSDENIKKRSNIVYINIKQSYYSK